MHANTLPDDVLFLIAKQATSPPPLTPSSWGSQLVLLAVCTRWRRVMLPLVYGRLSVTCGTLKDMLRLVRDGHTTDAPGYANVQTNAQLVGQAGCADLVRSVYVSVSHLGDPSFALDTAVQECLQIMPSWSRVRKLTLYLAGTDAGREPADDAEPVLGVPDIVARLVGAFPSVVSLSLEGVHTTGPAASICSRIANHYAGQARRLVCQHSVDVAAAAGTAAGTRFERLEALEYTFDENHLAQPPLACADQLVALRMLGVPPDFAWEQFRSGGSKRGPLVFPRLTRLALSYDQPWVDGRRSDHSVVVRGPRLVFPRLELLELVHGTGSCPIFLQGEFPAGIRRVRVNCPASHVRELAQCPIPRIDSLVLTVTGSNASEIDADLAAISVLGRAARQTPSATLAILGSAPLCLSADAACPWLTELFVTAPTSTATVLCLARQLPNLITLRLTCVHLDEARARRAWQPDDEAPLPIASRIEAVTLSFARSERLGVGHTVFAVTLLARLPAVQTLTALQLPPALFKAHVAELLAHAPHLASVELVLGDSA
ncbi:hypothetical protein H4R19_003347 [Coemansia spiralis]|nr:hypothetical protein H4R19_003347 [Coemansia spiralis]